MHLLIRLGLLVVLIATTGFAQLNQNHPNATLVINAQEPATVDPVDHDVTVFVPGGFQIAVSSGSNTFQPVVLLASPLEVTGPGFVVPWGGTIDVGSFLSATNTPANIELAGDGFTGIDNTGVGSAFVTDGLGFLTLNFANVAAVAGGQRVAFQALVRDPSNPPFLLRSTSAGDANFTLGQRLILPLHAVTNVAGTTQVPFVSGSFNFHGINYTDVHVNRQGFVTFGAPSSSDNFGLLWGNQGWIVDRPAIAPLLGRWDPANVNPLNGVVFEEIDGSVRISWGDPSAQTTGGMPHLLDDDLNHFELTLELDNGTSSNEGGFSIEHIVLDETALRQEGAGLFGHTPGVGAQTQGIHDRDFRQPQTGLAQEAMIEEHLFERRSVNSFGMPIHNIGWDGNGAFRSYNNLHKNWRGSRIDFVPVTATVAGAQGYTSTSSGPLPPDDFQGTHIEILDALGGETVTLAGSFFGFDPDGDGSGTVIFDPDGYFGGPYPAGIIGILDSSGMSGPLASANPQPSPVRDGQGLVVVTPPIAAPRIVPIEVTFDSGLVKRTQQPMIDLTGTNTTFTSYTQQVVPEIQHNLTVPIVFGGATHNSVVLNYDGLIRFAANIILTGVPNEFLFLNGGLFGPAIAPYWTMLSPNTAGLESRIAVLEDPVAGFVQIAYLDQVYFTIEPAGDFVVSINNGFGLMIMDHLSIIPPHDVTFGPFIGVTDGDMATPTFTSFTNGMGTGLLNALGSYVSPMAPDSIGETLPPNFPPPFTAPINFLDAFSNFSWILF